jgi:hypothetical protein
MSESRASMTALMVSEMDNSPAFASCKRTPPVSSSSNTPRGPVLAGEIACCAQQANEFRAMYFAEGAAEEAPLLSGDKNQFTIEEARADDHAVVEGTG